MKEKTFLICPVRGANLKIQEPIVKELEKDYLVYWPARDTHQNDPIGLVICRENLKAMQEANVVHIIWDGKSQGSLFDLGMAFALGKDIIPLELPSPTSGKSFQNMINAWKIHQSLIHGVEAATEKTNVTVPTGPKTHEKKKAPTKAPPAPGKEKDDVSEEKPINSR